jgi:hypothetical protein
MEQFSAKTMDEGESCHGDTMPEPEMYILFLSIFFIGAG